MLFIRILILLATISLYGVIRRDDISDNLYKDYGRSVIFLPVGKVSTPNTQGTGTLIDAHTVLTAAHVVMDHDSSIFSLYNSSGALIDELNGKVFIHEDFFYEQDESKNHLITLRNDIALIRLPNRVNHTPYAKLLYNQEVAIGSNCYSAGFGKYGNGSEGCLEADYRKRGFTNQIEGDCFWGDTERFLVIYFDQPDGTNVTNLEGLGGPGDSGAPIFLKKMGKEFVVGIISALQNKGLYGEINLILPLSDFEEWIESNRFTVKSNSSELGGAWNSRETWENSIIPNNSGEKFFDVKITKPVMITATTPIYIDSLLLNHELATLTVHDFLFSHELDLRRGLLSLESPSVESPQIQCHGEVQIGGSLHVNLLDPLYDREESITLIQGQKIEGFFDHIEIESNRPYEIFYKNSSMGIQF